MICGKMESLLSVTKKKSSDEKANFVAQNKKFTIFIVDFNIGISTEHLKNRFQI